MSRYLLFSAMLACVQPKARKVATPLIVSMKWVLEAASATDIYTISGIGICRDLLERALSLQVQQPKLSRGPEVELLDSKQSGYYERITDKYIWRGCSDYGSHS